MQSLTHPTISIPIVPFLLTMLKALLSEEPYKLPMKHFLPMYIVEPYFPLKNTRTLHTRPKLTSTAHPAIFHTRVYYVKQTIYLHMPARTATKNICRRQPILQQNFCRNKCSTPHTHCQYGNKMPYCNLIIKKPRFHLHNIIYF